MPILLYVRLIGFTAGTLLQLFWMVVILGYRRQRNFERVFFFLCLALFLFYSGSLLALNAQIYYTEAPAALRAFALTLLSAGVCFLPPLLIHLHLEYADSRGLLEGHDRWKHLLLTFAYAPAAYFVLKVYSLLGTGEGFDFLAPGNALGRGYGLWLMIAMGASALWQFRFSQRTNVRAEKMFHVLVAVYLTAGTVVACFLQISLRPIPANALAIGSTALALFPIFPSAALVYAVQRFNFLQIGRQKNLLYAVSATFLALLYLALVRRVSVWLEPVLPPEASAAILLFVLVIFIEPLQRVLGRHLRETAQREMDVVQRLTAEIQQKARQGDMTHLVSFIESRLTEQFEFAEVGLMLFDPNTGKLQSGAAQKDFKEGFTILQGTRTVGTLCVEPHGAMISGETRAALEFLCEQLPAALDLCRLIEEKVELERELAERERLAALGQMAASISHNLKNPLGSMKTILQLQLESHELPDSLRGETRLVLEEIERLSAKLNQLLRFSRPAVRSGSEGDSCDAREATEAVTGVMRHEAERRGVRFETTFPERGFQVAASSEAVHEMLTNLVVNALEAAPSGGHVALRATANGRGVEFTVEDDGAGISEALRERIFQPFFTTKAQGTGLGLAIVVRRVAEFGGNLEWESPVKDGHGTRFRVWLPKVK